MKSTTARTTAWITFICIIIAMFGAFYGSGAVGGTPINEAADGWLSATATLLAPAGPAFGIWSIIYLGLAGYAIIQLLPETTAWKTPARLRLPAAGSAVLNALWIAVVQFGLLELALAVIVLLCALLCWCLHILATWQHPLAKGSWITRATFGLYLGWVSVAMAANAAATLASHGIGLNASWAVPLAWAIVIIAMLFGALSLRALNGQVWVALGITWALAWIGQGRLAGANHSTSVGITALCSAALLLVLILGTLCFKAPGFKAFGTRKTYPAEQRNRS